jgi:hypothetical protein
MEHQHQSPQAGCTICSVGESAATTAGQTACGSGERHLRDVEAVADELLNVLHGDVHLGRHELHGGPAIRQVECAQLLCAARQK